LTSFSGISFLVPSRIGRWRESLFLHIPITWSEFLYSVGTSTPLFSPTNGVHPLLLALLFPSLLPPHLPCPTRISRPYSECFKMHKLLSSLRYARRSLSVLLLFSASPLVVGSPHRQPNGASAKVPARQRDRSLTFNSTTPTSTPVAGAWSDLRKRYSQPHRCMDSSTSYNIRVT
jgi:hypothetical protein